MDRVGNIWKRSRKCFKKERLEFLVPDVAQPLTHHLDELRRRLIICLVWVIVFSGIGFFFVDPILNWLAKPVGEFVFTAPAEAFFIHVKVALGAGCVSAFPIWIYQLWKFIGRALEIRERTLLLRVLPYGIGLFFVGSVVSLFVVTPVAIKFLLSYASPTLKPMISLSDYLSFIFWMIIGFGVFFQLPLVVVTLARTGAVHPDTFATYRPHIIVAIFLAAALLTPGPDVFSQLVMAIPSYLLFEVSLVIARRSSRP